MSNYIGARFRIQLLSLIGLLFLSLPIYAGSPGDQYSRVFLWAHSAAAPVGSPYRPSGYYAMAQSWQTLYSGRKSATTHATVERVSTGKYVVTLGDYIPNNGVVHVSAYGGSHFCTVERWWKSGAELLARVNCFNTSGARSNGKFTFMYYQMDSTPESHGQGYAWASSLRHPIGETYLANSNYQFNSSGQTNTIERVATGTYDVIFPDLRWMPNWDISRISFMITAYGSQPRYCNMRSGGIVVATDEHPDAYGIITVQCFDHDGTLQDSRFTVSIMDNNYWGAEYATDGLLSRSKIGLDPENTDGDVTRLSTGRYRVDFEDIRAYSASSAFVTPLDFDSVGNHCSINYWYRSPKYDDGAAVYVDCYNKSGKRADSFFQVNYFTNESARP